jgi:exopolyphosphatase/guanosine-5'-triphosphate,3'-diphosphate pyrophosphatase
MDDCSDEGLIPMIVAAIDVGTNTTRLLVARVTHDGIFPLATESAMTALGDGLDATGMIAPDGFTRIDSAIRAMIHTARSLNVVSISIVCTAVGRDARNADELLACIHQASGLDAQILTGEREAELSFRGLMSVTTTDPLVAGDLGGGSLELMGGTGGALEWAISLPLGVRKLTERRVHSDPPDIAVFTEIADIVASEVQPIARTHPSRTLLMTGGTAAALAKIAGTEQLTSAVLMDAASVLSRADARTIAARVGLDPERIRMSFAGAAAFEGIRAAFSLDHISMATAGLREGIILEAYA